MLMVEKLRDFLKVATRSRPAEHRLGRRAECVGRNSENSFQSLRPVHFTQKSALSLPRLLILTIGPVGVLAMAYVVAAPQSSPAMVRPQSAISPSPISTAPELIAQTLAKRCHVATDVLRKNLPADFEIVVRCPFLIAGDLPKSQLQGLHADVIAPVTRALNATYFERAPQQPITIIVCSTEELFRRLATAWDGHLDPGYHGYYQRDKRRILLDLEAGNGSLAHELTHALSQADCERLPEWFDEGLGALHEEATYAAGGLRLPNWRCRLTQQAARSGKLPSFAAFADPLKFRAGDVGLNYAVARSLCLFLQDRKVLTQYYKELRTRSRSDALGMATLCRVLRVKNETQAQGQFLTWIRATTGR